MYGLEPNWDKTVHLRIRRDMDIRTPQGMPLKTVTSAVYLGSLLRADGKTGASVARRVGEARASFDALQAVWRHANISRARKVNLFSACVVSKLTYSLETLCLHTADRVKIDAFQAQCLRKIFNIAHSMISHVSNAEVRRRANQQCLSQQLLARQLFYYGELSALPSESLPRQSVFQSGTSRLLDPGRRRRGRPRLQWASVMHAHALTIATCMHGGALSQEEAARQTFGRGMFNRQAWKEEVLRYCSN